MNKDKIKEIVQELCPAPISIGLGIALFLLASGSCIRSCYESEAVYKQAETEGMKVEVELKEKETELMRERIRLEELEIKMTRVEKEEGIGK
jgi:hypothetical protein